MTLPIGFFTHEGDRYVPTGRGISPWNGHSIGGLPIAGLLGHIMDRTPAPTPMHPARLTIDILGAVPMVPLTPTVTIAREGKRVQLVDVALTAQGRVWARASGLRVRMDRTAAQHMPPTRAFPVDPADAKMTDVAEMIRVDAASPIPDGTGARWARFPYPVIVGQALTPFEMAAMGADFGSGISPLFPYSDWTFANLDISLHLTRLPRGEWLLVDAESQSSGNGVAIARSLLGDRDGMFGTSTQTVFLDRR